MESDVYLKIAELLQKQEQAVVVTIVNATPGTPRKIGAKMLVMKDGSIIGTVGGGLFEKQIIDMALKVADSGEPRMINRDLSVAPGGIGAVCGGEVSIFLDPIIKTSRLFIFGGGHVGKAIAEMAQFMEFAINIIDDRPEWANRENYPMNSRLWVMDMIEAAEQIPVDANSCIVILTRSWKIDEAILKRLIRKDYTYLGIIGSKSKQNTHVENLLKEGFTEEDFKRIYAPIGLPIGAYAPHEIAVSILGEIIAVMKGKRAELPGW